MLILLPPSERKAPAPRRRAALDLASLHHPGLNAQRERTLRAAAAASAGTDALAVLGVGASAAEDVARNVAWASEPAHPAGALFTGVLYDALGLPSLDAAARRRARATVRVVSAAYGLLHLSDAVPAHRLSMGTSLPGLGPLATAWRPHLAIELDPLVVAGTVVVDVRSAAYVPAWTAPRACVGQVVQVAVINVGACDARTVVSHAAKHARGLLVRHLVTRGGRWPRSVDAVADAASEAFEVELDPPVPGRPRRLTVVLRPGQAPRA